MKKQKFTNKSTPLRPTWHVFDLNGLMKNNSELIIELNRLKYVAMNASVCG